jgi:16S rRNA (uracil1498-N3)-methyltransferase
MKRGDEVTYTDGLGTVGKGVLGSQTIERGDEDRVDKPTRITVAVAPPANKDRQRFLVEKLAELGVERLIWLDTIHGKDRIAGEAKVVSWILAATEQSRGAWLMEVAGETQRVDELDPGWVACEPGGSREVPEATTVAIGPEGGFAEGELPANVRKWDLGPTVLRVETAAIVATSKLMG